MAPLPLPETRPDAVENFSSPSNTSMHNCLTTSNYLMWSTVMKRILIGEGLWSVTNGSDKRPEASYGMGEEISSAKTMASMKKPQNDWDANDSKAVVLILGSLSKDVQLKIADILDGTTANGLWTEIKKRFDRSSTIVGRRAIINEISSAKQKDDEDIRAFCSRVISLYQSLQGTPAEVSASFAKMAILNSLPSIYDNICNEMAISEITLNEVVERLIKVESRNVIRNESKGPTNGDITNSASESSTARNNNNATRIVMGNNSRSSDVHDESRKLYPDHYPRRQWIGTHGSNILRDPYLKGTSKKWCSYCKMFNHHEADCGHIKRFLRWLEAKSCIINSNGKRSASTAPEGEASRQQGPVCYTCGKTGHLQRMCTASTQLTSRNENGTNGTITEEQENQRYREYSMHMDLN